MANAPESGNRTAREAAQASNVPLDAHLHTDLSPDSGVPLELYCAQAAERGVREIAITDHLDFMPGAPAYQYASYKRRESMVRDAAERWSGKVIVRFGIAATRTRSASIWRRTRTTTRSVPSMPFRTARTRTDGSRRS
jgi:hypothetical protein